MLKNEQVEKEKANRWIEKSKRNIKKEQIEKNEQHIKSEKKEKNEQKEKFKLLFFLFFRFRCVRFGLSGFWVEVVVF